MGSPSPPANCCWSRVPRPAVCYTCACLHATSGLCVWTSVSSHALLPRLSLCFQGICYGSKTFPNIQESHLKIITKLYLHSFFCFKKGHRFHIHKVFGIMLSRNSPLTRVLDRTSLYPVLCSSIHHVYIALFSWALICGSKEMLITVMFL